MSGSEKEKSEKGKSDKEKSETIMRPVAFVTGASRGIGAGIVLEFAKAGYDLALNYATPTCAAHFSALNSIWFTH
ncbi:MAG: hypothetical protein LBB94_08540 [Clostridiales bacterium]|nr:hypothetical protein [Clostridiales bacterium]